MLENLIDNPVHAFIVNDGLVSIYAQNDKLHTSRSMYAFEGKAAKTSHSLKTGKSFIPTKPAMAKYAPVLTASWGSCLKKFAIMGDFEKISDSSAGCG